MKLKFALIGAVLISLSACATAPEPAPITEKTADTTPPVFSDPAPVAPVAEAAVPALPEAPIAGSLEHFKYVAGDNRVYFAYDSYNLTPQAREVLRGQSDWLKEYGTSILVVGGHADERGTREYNLALGARRADTVKAFLVSQGVNPSRITTVSYGKERPIEAASSEAAWSLNRNAHSAVLIGGNSSS